jgi:ribosomal protein L24
MQIREKDYVTVIDGSPLDGYSGQVYRVDPDGYAAVFCDGTRIIVPVESLRFDFSTPGYEHE